jgi:hypothetical protein
VAAQPQSKPPSREQVYQAVWTFVLGWPLPPRYTPFVKHALGWVDSDEYVAIRMLQEQHRLGWHE